MKNIQRDLFQTSTAVPTRAISNVNLRTRVLMAEQVEAVIKELEGAPGMSALSKSRCLSGLAQVAEKVHRWSSEPTSEEMSRLKTAAVNLELIRTQPWQLRERARKAALAVEEQNKEKAADGV